MEKRKHTIIKTTRFNEQESPHEDGVLPQVYAVAIHYDNIIIIFC